MERRIKLSNEDLKTITEVLDDATDSVIEGLEDIDECEKPQQNAYAEELGRLAEEFRNRIEPDEDED